ncbi:uncharacterized protein N7511_001364 [Penicillium nucicola]|uniref:uncharacterized protein n=1 Tax=Penicillium nucicola TaxID=1850975 RepID=UPI0025456751|nr:uncharacterized protein N7511_001364 [Penicillium nucicola]KAJ5776353.1 hypothetical protein N7511_001364 [Penicillium nucicola]
MSGEPDLTQRVPSFGELDVSLKQYWIQNGKPPFLVDDGTSENVNANQNMRNMYTNTIGDLPLPPANPYPIYPLQGHSTTSDPSFNIFHKHGFTSQGVFGNPNESMLVRTRYEAAVGNEPHNASPITFSNTNITSRSPPEIISPRQAAEQQAASTPTLVIYPRRRTTREIVVSFSDVAAHTAKCDEGNERNRDGMSRCNLCGWQICRACINRRAGDRSHSSFGSDHIEDRARRRQIGPIPHQEILRTENRPEGQTSASARASETPLSTSRAGSGSQMSEEASAAQTLVTLGSSGRVDESISGASDCEPAELQVEQAGLNVQPKDRPLCGRKRARDRTDVIGSESENTLSPATESYWGDSNSATGTADEPEIVIREDGKYQLARRNPKRRARPSARMAD